MQFAAVNYQANQNRPFLMASGNRVDLLVKAPPNTTNTPQTYTLTVRDAVSKADTQLEAANATLLTVEVAPGAPIGGNQSAFIPAELMGASFPPFLADIAPEDVRATKKIVFRSSGARSRHIPSTGRRSRAMSGR